MKAFNQAVFPMNSYFSTSTITSKRQITLPVRLCRKLGLGPGSLVWVAPHPEGFTLEPVRVDAVRFDAAYGRFSLRCTSSRRSEPVVAGNLTAKRVTQLTRNPSFAARATSRPDAWVEAKEASV